MIKSKQLARAKRERRIRVKVSGTIERPRLSVTKTLANLFAQLIDDSGRKTILSVSTLDKKIKGAGLYGGNVKAATLLGEIIAQQAKAKGVSKVVFDRRGRPYHGRIKALAEAARKAGLEF